MALAGSVPVEAGVESDTSSVSGRPPPEVTVIIVIKLFFAYETKPFGSMLMIKYYHPDILK